MVTMDGCVRNILIVNVDMDPYIRVKNGAIRTNTRQIGDIVKKYVSIYLHTYTYVHSF